jgi:hypothetical protein
LRIRHLTDRTTGHTGNAPTAKSWFIKEQQSANTVEENLYQEQNREIRQKK